MGKISKKTEIDDDYLRAFLASTFAVFNGAKTGAAIPHLDKEAMYQLEFPLPPLPEQQRIVGLLHKAFAAIATAKANAETNLRNARVLFESAITIAIQGKLIPQNVRDTSASELLRQVEKSRNAAISQGRAKQEKTKPIERRDTGQDVLPNSWEWVQLESLTVGISDGVHKKPHYTSDGIPFITVKNLTSGQGISFNDLNYIKMVDHKEFIKRTHPEKGDILITKDGTIGVVRLIDTDIEFSIFVSVALIKPVLRELGPYLVYALRAPCVQNQIVPQGTALKHLYLVDLRRLAIPLPPLAEQQRIVARLDALNAETQSLASVYERKVAALDALKRSLLHQAFTGNL
jgi:type I restriction enzyme S subunit